MIGRPDRTEAAEFYWTYIDKVSGDDVIAVLESQMEEALILHAAVTEERSLYRYAPGKWSVRESMNHVTDTERIFVYRALWFARGFSGPLPGFDQDVAVEGAAADGLAWATHVDEFIQVRVATIAFFKNLPEVAWMRQGVASERAFTVRAMSFIGGRTCGASLWDFAGAVFVVVDGTWIARIKQSRRDFRAMQHDLSAACEKPLRPSKLVEGPT